MRELINGSKVSEKKSDINITISTRCPKKWLFIDCESGHTYGSDGVRWVYPEKNLLDCCKKIIKNELR